MKEFFEKYVKKYRNYLITSDTVASTFMITGAILKELRNPNYKVFRYPGNELPRKREKMDLEEFAKSKTINDYLVLSKNNDDVVATYPMQLLYLIDPDLYEKYRRAPKIDLIEIAKKNIKHGPQEKETEKFFIANTDYILTDILYAESLAYYPMVSDIIDDDEFEKYIIIYPDTETDELPPNLPKMPPEERAREAKKTAMTVLFIHKKTGTPLTIPLGSFMVIEPEKALHIWKNFKKITPEEFIKILEKHVR